MAGGDAILFPGQGSQHDGMREAVARAAPDLLELATELVGADPFERLDAGTAFVQPAIFCASVASWRECRAATRPLAFAGHSLGELAALAAADALDPRDALGLVVARGRLTQEVARAAGGGMIALLGVDRPTAEAIAAACELWVANDNCPGQIVLSGSHAGVARAEAEASERELKFAVLAVDGPFHSPAMADAAAAFARHLEAVPVREPSAPILSCVTARPFEDVRRQLAESLVSEVRWRAVIERLAALGADRFVEMAPDRVLTNMVKRTLPGAPRIAVERQLLEAPA